MSIQITTDIGDYNNIDTIVTGGKKIELDATTKWGEIEGTIANQVDLLTLIDDKTNPAKQLEVTNNQLLNDNDKFAYYRTGQEKIYQINWAQIAQSMKNNAAGWGYVKRDSLKTIVTQIHDDNNKAINLEYSLLNNQNNKCIYLKTINGCSLIGDTASDNIVIEGNGNAIQKEDILNLLNRDKSKTEEIDCKINIGDKFKVDENGNVTFGGIVTWGAGSSPYKVLYARTLLDKPDKTYSNYNVSDEGAVGAEAVWHTALDDTNDKYVSYSYDGGATWAEPVQIENASGTNGSSAIDADELFNVLTSGDTKYGLFGADNGKLYIKSQYLKSEYGSIGCKLNVGNGNFVVTDSGDVTMKGNINLNGNITWGANNSPCKVLYARTLLGAPSSSYTTYVPNAESGWHTALDTTNDKYISYSYDGGATWTDPIQIKNTNDSDLSCLTLYTNSETIALNKPESDTIYSSNNTDEWHTVLNSANDIYASYSYDSGTTWTDAMPIISNTTIYNILTSGDTRYGLFGVEDGKLYIKASYLKADVANANDLIMGNACGGIRMANGLNSSGDETTGVKLYSANYTKDNSTYCNYMICTTGGVRMTSEQNGAEIGAYNSGIVKIVSGKNAEDGNRQNKILSQNGIIDIRTAINMNDADSQGRAYITLNSSGITASTSISTSSDERIKNNINMDMDKYEDFFYSLHPSYFKYNTGTSDRYHTGFIAQDVAQALVDNGLTTQDFAGFVNLQNTNDASKGEPQYEVENQLALRYEEFIALNTYMIQKLSRRIDELEATIQELQNKN